jgi:hypothetical protein
MTIRIFAATCFCAASVVGQQAPVPASAKAAQQAPPQRWRTPWGEPDLQGTWTNATTTPLERPAKYMGREFLSKEERAAQDKDTEIATDKRHKVGTPQDVEDAYNGAWWDRGRSDGRTSLIYDPPDGLIPPPGRIWIPPWRVSREQAFTRDRNRWTCIHAALFARRCRGSLPVTTITTRLCNPRDSSPSIRNRFMKRG